MWRCPSMEYAECYRQANPQLIYNGIHLGTSAGSTNAISLLYLCAVLPPGWRWQWSRQQRGLWSGVWDILQLICPGAIDLTSARLMILPYSCRSRTARQERSRMEQQSATTRILWSRQCQSNNSTAHFRPSWCFPRYCHVPQWGQRTIGALWQVNYCESMNMSHDSVIWSKLALSIKRYLAWRKYTEYAFFKIIVWSPYYLLHKYRRHV